MGLMYKFTKDTPKPHQEVNYDTSHCAPSADCWTSAGLWDGTLDVGHLIEPCQWSCDFVVFIVPIPKPIP